MGGGIFSEVETRGNYEKSEIGGEEKLQIQNLNRC